MRSLGGLIDEQIAKTRRAEISKESEFYGAMDGASKFVRGMPSPVSSSP